MTDTTPRLIDRLTTHRRGLQGGTEAINGVIVLTADGSRPTGATHGRAPNHADL